MSIILDALRKSEAARRRNEAPELFASMPNSAEPARGVGAWPRWSVGLVGAVGVLGIVCLAVALWLTMRRDSASSEAIGAQGAQDSSAAAAASTSPSSTPSANNAESLPSDGGPQADAAVVAAPRNTTLETPAQAVTGDEPRAVAPASAAASIRPPTVPSTTPPTTPAKDIAMSTGPAAAPAGVAPTLPPRTPAPPISAPGDPATASPPTAFRSPRSDAPMAVADLDTGTRKQLPPLKLSMHVWNDAPAQRFVILDGQRLREGDVLGEVVVERITRDGAQLSWRGTALTIEWR